MTCMTYPHIMICGYIINIIYTVIVAILFRQLQVGYSYNTSLLFAIPSLWSFFFLKSRLMQHICLHKSVMTK